MELILDPLLEKLKNIHQFDLISQKQFKKLSINYPHIPLPEELKDRKFDYVIIKNGTYINIEVNYYSGSGSKPQEIVDSYINRMTDLKKHGWHFIWITDGNGWSSGKNQITKAFEKQDYVLNLHFIRKGVLNEILNFLLKS